jgi:DNA-directed RNA polymerase specialized sigma24 family protein
MKLILNSQYFSTALIFKTNDLTAGKIMDKPKNHDEQDEKQLIHPCLKFQGKGPECEKCSIKQYCAKWCETIPKLENFLRYERQGLPKEVVKDILNVTYDEICKGIDSFKHGTLFFVWCRSICASKRKDFLRKNLRKNVTIVLPFIPTETITDESQDLDEQDEKVHMHPCLKFKDKDKGCERCSIIKYCKVWRTTTIPYLQNILRSYGSGLSDEDVERIIGITFDEIRRKIGALEKDEAFTSWCKRICDNKRYDFFKKNRNKNVEARLPFIPEGLVELCNRATDYLRFYPSDQRGTLEVIAISIPAAVEIDLKALSQRPSWQKDVERLKKKRLIKIYNLSLESGITDVCVKYNQSITYQYCEPNGTLYSINSPFPLAIRDELFALDNQAEWKTVIKKFCEDALLNPTPHQISIHPHKDGIGGFDLPNPEDSKQSIGYLNEQSENKQYLEKLILKLEKIDIVCAKLFRDKLENFKLDLLDKDLAKTRDETEVQLRQKFNRCLKKLHFHLNTKEIIGPGDKVVVESVREKAGFLWCQMNNREEIRSEKKILDDTIIETFQKKLASKRVVTVEIVGCKANKNGNKYFLTFEFLSL